MEMVATSRGVPEASLHAPRPSSNAQKKAEHLSKQAWGLGGRNHSVKIRWNLQWRLERASCRWVQLWIASKCPATAQCDDRQGGKYLPGIRVDPSIIIRG